ncbi:hypothetical protein [Sphingomonas melonis]|uniref:Uncharacterized protein n=1 Tax=Sphingomonas melonis TaxID=152682 RepID=A0A7Y9FSH0_9SPHN|nr:hypothetical protein [Sphingomonas melonis]NYD91441.1 hypothetical protein [Sphingomonas melonis]
MSVVSVGSVRSATRLSASSGGAVSTRIGAVPATSLPDADPKATADLWAAEFVKEARKSPTERIRDDILRRHNLTEAQFAALSKAQQAGITREIEEAIKRVVKVPKKPETKVDVVA